jgi:hypothetical protein
MKGKLIKTEVNYLLEDNKGIVIASTSLKGEGINLSKRNCDDILGVVNVEKLACKEIKIDIDTYKDIHKKATEKNASPCIPSREGGCVGANLYSQVNGFIKGYNKAMELNKEKLFTEDDINLAFVLGKNNDESRINKLINSKIQPTEIEVEIITVPMNIDEIREQGKGFLNSNTNKPKLDENGNLILRKL